MKITGIESLVAGAPTLWNGLRSYAAVAFAISLAGLVPPLRDGTVTQ